MLWNLNRQNNKEKKPNSYCSCTKQITVTQVSQVPSSSHIIESDNKDIIQHVEKELSNVILFNIFGEESGDWDSDGDI